MNLLANIFIGISTVIYATSLLLTKKSKLLAFQICSSLFFITHYFLLNALTGAIIAITELIRLITFYIIETNNNNKTHRIVASVIFIIIGIIGSILTWTGWYCILPLLGLIFVCTCLAFKNLTILKTAYVISAICTTAYMLFIKSYFSAITQFIVVIIGIIGLITSFIKLKKESKITGENNNG